MININSSKINKTKAILRRYNLSYLAIISKHRKIIEGGDPSTTKIAYKLHDYFKKVKASKIILETKEGKAIVMYRRGDNEIFIIADRDIAYLVLEIIKKELNL